MLFVIFDLRIVCFLMLFPRTSSWNKYGIYLVSFCWNEKQSRVPIWFTVFVFAWICPRTLWWNRSWQDIDNAIKSTNRDQYDLQKVIFKARNLWKHDNQHVSNKVAPSNPFPKMSIRFWKTTGTRRIHFQRCPSVSLEPNRYSCKFRKNHTWTTHCELSAPSLVKKELLRIYRF